MSLSYDSSTKTWNYSAEKILKADRPTTETIYLIPTIFTRSDGRGSSITDWTISTVAPGTTQGPANRYGERPPAKQIPYTAVQLTSSSDAAQLLRDGKLPYGDAAYIFKGYCLKNLH